MTTNETIRDRRSTALITGGSRGIGFELAKQFAQHGHDLILVSRNQSELRRAADKLHKEFDCTVTAVSFDLTARDAPEALLTQLQAQAIQVDVLVNNAGLGDYGLFVDSQLDRQLDMLQLNILSLTALTRLFLKGMIERGSGRILNVASVVAYFSGGPCWSSYVASKHYVLAFTLGLAKELTGTGVSATLLCPGPTTTEFISNAGVGAMRVYRWVPKLSASGVARAGYQATMAGRTTVIPGLLNKVLALLGELPPRGIAGSVFSFLSRGTA